MQGKGSQAKFPNWICVQWGRVSFLFEPSANYVRRDKEILCNYEKREINTFENFPVPNKIISHICILKAIVFLVFELLERGEVLQVPCADCLSEDKAWAAFRDVLLGLEYCE